MATYCTQEHIEKRKSATRLAKITGDATGEEVDTDRVEEAIDEYSEKIDAAVRNHHPDLPFDDEHKLLRGLNVEGAWLLLVRDSDRGWTEDDREEWKMLEDQLKGIAAGTIDLRSESEDEEDDMVEGYFSSNKRRFGRGEGL